jgi:hypothetical protein
VDFFVFVRNGPSFTTSLVYPWRRGMKLCKNGLQGMKERIGKQMYKDKGMKERGERRDFLFY